MKWGRNIYKKKAKKMSFLHFFLSKKKERTNMAQVGYEKDYIKYKRLKRVREGIFTAKHINKTQQEKILIKIKLQFSKARNL